MKIQKPILSIAAKITTVNSATSVDSQNTITVDDEDGVKSCGTNGVTPLS